MTGHTGDQTMIDAQAVARTIGTLIGRAMARDVIAEDMAREWTGLGAQDVDMVPDGIDVPLVGTAAREAYDAIIGLQEMTETLESYGEMFTGNCAEDEAQDWIDHGFDAHSASDWLDAYLWDAGTAADLRNAGLTPDQVVAAEESLIDGLDDDECRMKYPDGPIYCACNGSLHVNVIIDAARKLAQ